MTPDVSVVIPTMNRPALVAVALASVLGQRDVDLEVLVVDESTDDETAQLVARADDERVTLVRPPTRIGRAASRTAGVARARAEWVAFLDDDDVWAPDKLSRQLEAVRGAGLDWAYVGEVYTSSTFEVLSGGPPPTPPEVMAGLRRYNAVPAGGSTVLAKRATLERVGPFDPSLNQTEDWDMWIRLAGEGPPAWVPMPLVACRLHEANVHVDVEPMVAEPDLLARRYGIPVDRAAMMRRAAWTCLRGGQRRRAAGYYVRAIRTGDVTSLGRLALALLYPRVGLDGLRRPGARDASWVALAEAWLAELRESLPDAAAR